MNQPMQGVLSINKFGIFVFFNIFLLCFLSAFVFANSTRADMKYIFVLLRFITASWESNQNQLYHASLFKISFFTVWLIQCANCLFGLKASPSIAYWFVLFFSEIEFFIYYCHYVETLCLRRVEKVSLALIIVNMNLPRTLCVFN